MNNLIFSYLIKLSTKISNQKFHIAIIKLIKFFELVIIGELLSINRF